MSTVGPPTSRMRRFVRAIIAISLGLQLPGAILLATTLHSAGVPLAALLALAALAIANVPLFLRLRAGFGDRPTGALRLHLVDYPYFVVFAASFGFWFTAPLAWLGSLVVGAPALPVLQWTFLGTAVLGLYAVYVRPALVRVRREDVRIAGLPRALAGYRIVQLSDLHVGSQVSAERAARWVARANALQPDLVALTGDLISSGSSFLEATARTLGRLRAEDGVVFSPGNHDYMCDSDRFFRLLADAGIRVLRNEGTLLSRDGASLYVAGADDYWTRLADVARALGARPQDTPTVLLAHDPRLWVPAREKHVSLTLSGHTHGGQVALPFLSTRVNLARSTFEHSSGLYHEGDSWLCVSNGLGTTGVRARLGASPEIVVLTLQPAA